MQTDAVSDHTSRQARLYPKVAQSLRTYVTSKDGLRTVLVDMTDDLHALCWGRLLTSNRSARPAHLLTYEEAKIWITRERVAGEAEIDARRSAPAERAA